MTHTEESLMALAQACTVAAARVTMLGAAPYTEAVEELRLALREVLAERDRYLDIIRREAWLEHAAENDVASPYVPFTDWVAEKNRAEKAEAECERLRNALDRASRVMHGEGVEDQGEAWDKCLRILDAAMKEKP